MIMKTFFKYKGRDVSYFKHLDKDIYRIMPNYKFPLYMKTGELQPNGYGIIIYESIGYSQFIIRFNGFTNVLDDREYKDVYSMYVNDQLVLDGSKTTANGTWRPVHGLDYEAHASRSLRLDPTVVSKIIIRGQNDTFYAKETSRMSYEVTFIR